MSVVTVQLGQCGNQIGGQFFSTIIEDAYSKQSQVGVKPSRNLEYINETLDRFFSQRDTTLGKEGTLEARAVMVDMESKAIAQTCLEAKRSGKWKYPDKQQFCQKRGSGNNWAHGFCVHGPRVRDDVLNMLRREAEKCDNLSGFICYLSLAGGTGSGVGAYTTEALRDEYPHSFIMNQVVWPYQTGEVIVQNYNAMLTLSHLYSMSDAIVVMENDSLHKICQQLLNINKISFRAINKVVSHKMASFLQPAHSDSDGYTCSNDLGSLLHHLVPHPEYKLLTLKNIPQMSERALEFSTYQWHGLLKHLRQMLVADAAMEEGINWDITTGSATPRGSHRSNRSLANTLILRGKEAMMADVSAFQDKKLYTDWMPPDFTLDVLKQPRMFNQYEKSAVLVSNSQSPVGALENMISRAWTMFSSRAYVHQYKRHGLAEDDFIDSFVALEQVLASYKAL
ncbi:tubulin delta chain-like [Haliotis asinina]|uniref:tubulin delta chain-like n=1 Tax=Haliotis asinina TaxID=109174 RepID=UPI003531BADA